MGGETPFHDEVESNKRNLAFHKKLATVVKVLTLGIFRNAQNVTFYEESLAHSLQEAKEYEELKRQAIHIDGLLAETVEFEGIRISKNFFADVPFLLTQEYGIDWDMLRQQILERDDFQCQEEDECCNGPLQVHHVLELSKGGTNNASNLLTLCVYHHSMKHEHMKRQYNASLRC